MALDGITTLLATSVGPNSEQEAVGDLDQVTELTGEGDTVAFAEELLGFLAPPANQSNNLADVLPEVSESAVDDSISESESELFAAVVQPESADPTDASHFELAFASTFPIPAEPIPAASDQSPTDTALATEANAQPLVVSAIESPIKSTAESQNQSSQNTSVNDAQTTADSDGVVAETIDGSGAEESGSDESTETAAAEQSAERPQDRAAVNSLTESNATASTIDVADPESVIDSNRTEQSTTNDTLDAPSKSDATIAIPIGDTTSAAAVLPLQASPTSVTFAATDSSIVDAPNLAEQIANEAVKHADVVKHQGQQRFTMRLDPPELGKLVVEMKRTDKGLTLRVNAVDPATLGLIQTSLEELNNSLSQQDSVFQEMNIDVTTGGASEETFSERSPSQSFGERQSQASTTDDTTPASAQATAIDQNVSFVA